MKIAIIYNPAAGTARRLNRLARLERQLQILGNTTVTYYTSQSGEATELTRRAVVEGAEIVVAVGGDGTVNEVIQELVEHDVPLAVYPAGTTNVWCQQVNMPVNPRLAADVICNGPRYQVDLGQVGDRYFLLMIGIGLDGEIVQTVNLDLKKRVGKLAYVVAGWRALKFRGTLVNITLDSGRTNEHSITVRASLIIVTNSERYATLKLAHEAQVDDGQLEMLIFEDSRLSKKFAQAVSVLANRREWDVNIERYRVHTARIAANPPVAAQIDGDLMGQVGSQAVEIRCVHKAIRVIVPAKVPANLFSHGE